MTDSRRNVTALLRNVSSGDSRAKDELFVLVYDELRSQAARYLKDERPDHTLQATALVHEAYLRLVGSEGIRWTDRAHFYRAAAMAMRRILVDHARRHGADKRGGGHRRVSMSRADQIGSETNVDLIALDEALARLSELDAHKSRVVELRYFTGLTTEETAEVLAVSSRRIERDWSTAKAWLFRELKRRRV